MSEQKRPYIEIEHFSFYYPERTEKVLDDLTLTVEQGEFLVLCGPSGCGKSTLLRQLKTVLAPHGRRLGSIRFEGRPLEELDQREQSAGIGFVQQDPENQIVTDKVWHELAFGLESLGYDTPTIRRRVAEMASFFGIQTWFYKNVTELSGGQKQLLNLASIMAMQPSVLILDEPTSQLDPIAAADFLATLGKINRELGTTVVLTEHRLEDAFPLASRVAVMDRGRLLCTGSPAEVGAILRGAGHSMFLAMPTPMRIWASAPDAGGHCPVTVREGRDWLTGFADGHPLGELPAESRHVYPDEPAITAEGLWFKYEKRAAGCGKRVEPYGEARRVSGLTGRQRHRKDHQPEAAVRTPEALPGEVKLVGRVGVLPQNPQALFCEEKASGRTSLRFSRAGLSPERRRRSGSLGRCGCAVWRNCSTGTLTTCPAVNSSGRLWQRCSCWDRKSCCWTSPPRGWTRNLSRHSLRFCRHSCDRRLPCSWSATTLSSAPGMPTAAPLFFDGSIVTEAPPRAFFSGNSFYTTSANRMARGLIPEAVTAEDVILACGGTLPPVPELPDRREPLPEPEESGAYSKPKPLTWWRKLGAALTGAMAFLLFLSFMNITDLTKLITAGGMTELANHQIFLYALFILSLFLFAACITRRSHRKDYVLQVPRAKRKLAKRTIVAAVLILLLIPLTLYIGVFYLGNKKYYFISLMVLLECMLPFFLIFEGRKPHARELVIIAVLCAIGIAGRAAFFMLPQFKPVMALTIVAGVAFGGETGFLVGAMTMLASMCSLDRVR